MISSASAYLLFGKLDPPSKEGGALSNAAHYGVLGTITKFEQFDGGFASVVEVLQTTSLPPAGRYTTRGYRRTSGKNSYGKKGRFAERQALGQTEGCT